MSDVETAEEFITNNALTVNGIKPLEARDAAVAREAKAEVLRSLLAHALPCLGIPVVTADVIGVYLERYAAKESDGEA